MKLTVMSFNLRYDKPDPGERQWQNRVDAIAALIRHYRPDLLGTQEGKIHQLRDLQTRLPEYNLIGGDRTGTGLGEHCAIFYHPQNLQLQQTEDFYLSDTPEIPNSITPAWGNRLPRMATWGNFLAIEPKLALTIINTHLDHESAQARKNGAFLVNQKLATFSTTTYLLVTGDFNANPYTLERQIFLHSGRLKDALATFTLADQHTYHEFTGQAWDAIDTIYFDSCWQLDKVEIDRQQWLGVWPSDHFPVIATLSPGISS